MTSIVSTVFPRLVPLPSSEMHALVAKRPSSSPRCTICTSSQHVSPLRITLRCWGRRLPYFIIRSFCRHGARDTWNISAGFRSAPPRSHPSVTTPLSSSHHAYVTQSPPHRLDRLELVIVRIGSQPVVMRNDVPPRLPKPGSWNIAVYARVVGLSLGKCWHCVILSRATKPTPPRQPALHGMLALHPHVPQTFKKRCIRNALPPHLCSFPSPFFPPLPLTFGLGSLMALSRPVVCP